MNIIKTIPALALGLVLLPAQAGEIYGQIGLPGLGIGYAQPLNENFTLRGDFVTLGSRTETTTEEGIPYAAKLKAHRAALLADWFPMQGSFRISGGATFNQYQLDLAANGSSGSLTIGDTTYATTAADKLDVQIKFPATTPYLGIGWGHQDASGLRFSFDIGASFGRAKLTAAVSGPNAQNVSQADLDAELAELRDGVGKLRAIPQLSFGIGYSF
jgi:hypothetical protein